MAKSKNFQLFELFLEEMGQLELFEKVKGISLGHIVSFFATEDEYRDGDGRLAAVNLHRRHVGKPDAETILEVDNEDLNAVNAWDELSDLAEDYDISYLQRAIEKIDEYHENKNT